MGYDSYITLFLVVGVNIAYILVSCMLNTIMAKRSKKEKLIVTIILLGLNLIFDVACCMLFWVSGGYECYQVFVLFIPLTLMLLISAIKELRTP